MGDDAPSRARMGRPRSRSFIVEDDDDLDPETMLPKAALQPRARSGTGAGPPAGRGRGGGGGRAATRSGQLRGNALTIVSNLEAAARHTPPPAPGSDAMGSPLSSSDEAEAEAEERRLMEAMRSSSGSSKAFGRSAGAGVGAGAGAGGGAADAKKKKSDELVVRLLLLGDSGVGKTSLLNRYTEGKFNNTIMTAGVDYRVSHVTVDGKKVKLQIWDTAGQERFHVITRAYYRGAHGIILLYDVSDVGREESFKNVRYWMDNIRKHGNPTGVEKVLVGNKIDLPGPKIEASRGRQLADQFGLKHFQTSAKTGSGVKQVFTTITREIVKKAAAGEAAAMLATTTSAGDDGKKKKCTIM